MLPFFGLNGLTKLDDLLWCVSRFWQSTILFMEKPTGKLVKPGNSIAMKVCYGIEINELLDTQNLEKFDLKRDF